MRSFQLRGSLGLGLNEFQLRNLDIFGLLFQRTLKIQRPPGFIVDDIVEPAACVDKGCLGAIPGFPRRVAGSRDTLLLPIRITKHVRHQPANPEKVIDLRAGN
jgi:hypothetical protein